jgi:pyrroloquinoline quinone biosynthesis protein B
LVLAVLVRILGSAAGGGFPQWNSAAPGCARARSGDPKARRRSQTCVAVSADGLSWVLLNASPDLREQIERCPDLHPRTPPRSSPIGAVIPANGDVDAIAGLLSLREGHRFTILASAPVLGVLAANSIFDVLAPDLVERLAIRLHAPVAIPNADGLSAVLFPAPGKVPLYAEAGADPAALVADGRTVGVEISDGRRRLVFVPSCGSMSPAVRDRLNGADLVLFDATLYSDDEMIRTDAGHKTGRRMGHMSLSGPDGTLAAFETIETQRKVLIHINNTNPILLEDSREAAAVRDHGWIVAEDGMLFEL